MFMKLSNRDAFGYPLKFKSAKKAGLTNPILGLGPVLLLDADYISGSNDDAIGQWDDLSGNDNHAVQTTEANKPLLKTGENGINGYKALYADGLNDYMRSSFAMSSYREMTWVVAYKGNTTGGTKRLFSIQNGAGAWVCGHDKTGINNVSSSYTPDDTDAHIVIADFKENDSYNVWRDNILKGSGALGGLSWWSSVDAVNIMTDYSPDGRWWSGLIAYIAMFPTQLSTTDRAKVYNFLSGRYLT